MPRKKKGEGKTTVSPGGLIKKTFWFHAEEVQMLRKAAYEQETSQAELVRKAVRLFFDMPETAAGDDTEDLASQLRTDTGFQERLSEFLQEHAGDVDQAQELLSLLRSEQDDQTGG